MKATHLGHCQCCGRKQKLPGGRLSNHGYQVLWNSHQGICEGAGLPPMEQSRAKTDDIVAGLRRGADSVAALGRDYPLTAANRHCSRKDAPLVSDEAAHRDALIAAFSFYGKNEDALRHAMKEDRDSVEWRRNSRAKNMRNGADMLESLANEVHGRDLEPIK